MDSTKSSSRSHNKRHEFSHMTSYDFPPILKYFVLTSCSELVHLCKFLCYTLGPMTSHTTGTRGVKLERNRRGVVSRHKLYSCECKNRSLLRSTWIAIRYSRSGRSERIYDVHWRSPNILCNQHCQGKGFSSSTSKVRQVYFISDNCEFFWAGTFLLFEPPNYWLRNWKSSKSDRSLRRY